MNDVDPIPKPNLIPPEKPTHFGDNPLECAIKALVYGLRVYRQKVGNEAFTHSNPGYLYHSLPPPDVLKPEDPELNEMSKPPNSLKESSRSKNPSFIEILRQIFSTYPEPPKTNSFPHDLKSGRTKKTKKSTAKLFFYDGQQSKETLNELTYQEISIIFNGSNKQDKQPKKHDLRNNRDDGEKTDEFQIRLTLKDLDQYSEEIVETSFESIQNAIAKTYGNPEKIQRIKETAQRYKQLLPYKTELTISFEASTNMVNEPLGFINFLIYPDNRIVINFYVNESAANGNKTESEGPKFTKILEIPPEEHGLRYAQFEDYLNKLYTKLIET